MKIEWIAIGFFCLLFIILILRKAKRDGKKSLISESEFEETDKFSPEQLDFDRAIQNAHLRSKLEEIEEERNIKVTKGSIPWMTIDQYIELKKQKG